ncbi:M20/M25/M40 family metallo-hydrolase [Oceanobacillus sp. CFH 90083]|uniref:M20/M25/M40 family metallo-hydrolase n=1 Tax=Oceanobacillus sp. CFH 90083 TaxID=2592336 RepID=UPI00128DB4BB|nr:M20/M25/M40 family metallo-hydrolase [Oceanobacillus sp. CFH 90083]
MTYTQYDFLLELLHTPSPSGMEMAIQKKWINYVKAYADEIRTDHVGNAIAVLNPDAPFKVLLAGHCDEIGFIIQRVDERGFLFFEKVGGINHKAAVGMRVTILGFQETVTGVIGVNAQHHGGMKGDFNVQDLYIDCGFQSKEEALSKVQVGDLCVFKTDPEILQDRYISARGLDNRTGAFMVAEVIRKLSDKNLPIGVYGASTVNEETNMGGAYFAAAGVEPDFAIAMDVTFATDYPNVNIKKQAEVHLEGGPVLAKGAPIHRKINEWLEKAAKEKSIPLQYELTPQATSTDADKMRYTGKGVPVALVSLPLRYMHSPVETVSKKDIDMEIELLVTMLESMTGKENLNLL